MKNTFPFLPILFAAVFFCVFFFVMHFRRKKNLELLSRVSVRRGGTVQKGFPISFGTLVFQHGPHEVRVHSTPGSKNSPPKTKVSCPLDTGRDFKMEICREHILLKALKRVGMQDIEVGNDRFDGSFLVKGSDESSVKAILTPTIQERLLGLDGRGMNLALTPTGLKLVVNFIPESEYEYDPILDAFTAVLDATKAGNY